MSYKIKTIHAHEILDSRGNPTVNVSVLLQNGVVGSASVPSGASTGTHEALELRDGDRKRYRRKGVLMACDNVNGPILKLLRGHDARRQRSVDAAMIAGDRSKNKSRFGANAILGVSLAAARAAAKATRLPLYSYLRHAFRELRYPSYRLPMPFMNLVNGGLHADTDLDIQEILVIPIGAKRTTERVRVVTEIFHELGALLRARGLDTDLGDEGGYAPEFEGSEQALDLLVTAIRRSGYRAGRDVVLGIDAAASELYDAKRKRYVWKTDGLNLSREAMMKRYEKWTKKYPLYSIEDPFAEDDWAAWQKFTTTTRSQPITYNLKPKTLIIGDDLFVTNTERLRKGIALGAANAILVKPNQIGTLSETIDAIFLAQKNKFKVIISHRSGETCDTTIADLAVAVNADGLKAGSVARGERTAKYNRLIEIEEELRYRPFAK